MITCLWCMPYIWWLVESGRVINLKNFLLIFIFVNDTYDTSKYCSPRFTRLTAERSTGTFGQYRLISLHRESGK